MDKTKQELREQYEDALFALMMEEYARDEGKQLLERERQLKDDSDFQVPGDFEAKGLQIIRRACRRKNRSIAFGKKNCGAGGGAGTGAGYCVWRFLCLSRGVSDFGAEYGADLL